MRRTFVLAAAAMMTVVSGAALADEHSPVDRQDPGFVPLVDDIRC